MCSTLNCLNNTNLLANSSAIAAVSTSQSQPALFVTVLTYVDYVNRVVSSLMFIIYLVFVILLKELRTLNLLYVHHANFVGFIFVLMYMIYFTSSVPTTKDPVLFDQLCTATETIWGVVKYLRGYSVLLIALYRFMAVFYIEQFKTLNKSYALISAPIAVVWVLSVVLFLSTKFGFQTTYGNLFCIDGFSANLSNVIGYLTVSSFLCILVPFSLITLIYIMIRRKISQNRSITSSNHQSKTQTMAVNDPQSENKSLEMSLGQFSTLQETCATGISPMNRVKAQKQRARYEMKKNIRFNIQLIAMNICYIMCFSMSFVLSFRYVIVDFNERFYYFRQLLRILNILFQAMIPVLSLYFNPNISVRKIRREYFKNKIGNFGTT